MENGVTLNRFSSRMLKFSTFITSLQSYSVESFESATFISTHTNGLVPSSLASILS